MPPTVALAQQAFEIERAPLIFGWWLRRISSAAAATALAGLIRRGSR